MTSGAINVLAQISPKPSIAPLMNGRPRLIKTEADRIDILRVQERVDEGVSAANVKEPVAIDVGPPIAEVSSFSSTVATDPSGCSSAGGGPPELYLSTLLGSSVLLFHILGIPVADTVGIVSGAPGP